MKLGVAELWETNFESGVLFLRLAPRVALFFARNNRDVILAVVLSFRAGFSASYGRGNVEGGLNSERDRVIRLRPISLNQHI